MLDPKMEQRLNHHISEELFASYLYLSMSAHFSAEGFDGFANWLRKQSQEEYGHGMKIYDYINEQNGRVLLKAIAEPKTKFGASVEVFEDVLSHEQKVTRQINDLVNLAIQLGDHATHVFLHWFVTEQIEEESQASEVLQKVKLVGNNGPGLLALDRELGSRTAGD